MNKLKVNIFFSFNFSCCFRKFFNFFFVAYKARTLRRTRKLLQTVENIWDYALKHSWKSKHLLKTLNLKINFFFVKSKINFEIKCFSTYINILKRCPCSNELISVVFELCRVMSESKLPKNWKFTKSSIKTFLIAVFSKIQCG